jgi:microcystin-dependent protein
MGSVISYALHDFFKKPRKWKIEMESSISIGSVISYAGDLCIAANVQKLKAAGWLLCDGSLYKQSDYPELYAAIGIANGGDSANFNVPDLRDRFIRGRNNTASQGDPDANNRVAASNGGATGNHTGSLQESATALPTSNAFTVVNNGAHTHTVSHLTSAMHEAWSGSTYTMARWNAPADTDSGGVHSHMLSGYDNATVPINTALYFIIKASEPQSVDGSTPAGVIVGFAGALTAAPNNWLACDGMAYGTTTRFQNLNDMISYNYGGDGISVFNVPDLRGTFLRGTNHSTGRDPDANKRHDLNTGGAIGDATGSAQGYATAKPVNLQASSAGLHSHNIAKVPQNAHNAAWGASGPAAYNCMEWTNDTTTSTSSGDHGHSIIGGDKETRPANLYLDLLIASDNNLTSAPLIGSILPIGCDTTNLSNLMKLIGMGWLSCNGGKLPTADPAYSALYAVIGTTYGSLPQQFLLPDLRGYFVVGAGGQRKPGAVQESQTGTPVIPITTNTAGSHNHSINDIPTDTHVIDVVAGVDLAENNPNANPTSQDGAHVHTLSGGDKESRPSNVYVDYVIRYK